MPRENEKQHQQLGGSYIEITLIVLFIILFIGLMIYGTYQQAVNARKAVYSIQRGAPVHIHI